MTDEQILILAGGAVIVGLIVHRKLTDMGVIGSADDGEPGAGSTWSPAPLPYYPPAGSTTPPLYNPPAAAPPAPPPPPPPPPPVQQSAAEANAAFDAAMKVARAQQEADYQRQVAELRARVAAGEVVPGSDYYNSTLDYLANLRGGVATKDAEREALRQAGFAGGGRRRGHLRLV